MAPKIEKNQEAALYIERMSVELRDLAEGEGYDTLAYLLDMARLEAASVSLRSAAERKAGR